MGVRVLGCWDIQVLGIGYWVLGVRIFDNTLCSADSEQEEQVDEEKGGRQEKEDTQP